MHNDMSHAATQGDGEWTMSLDDDLEPTFQGHKNGFDEMNVESLSVEELKAYIEHAKREIARAEAEIAGREALRGDADALFKS